MPENESPKVRVGVRVLLTEKRPNKADWSRASFGLKPLQQIVGRIIAFTIH